MKLQTGQVGEHRPNLQHTRPHSSTEHSRDVRHVAQKAETYLEETAVGDAAYFGPELEHFVFDDVRYDQSTNYGYYEIDAIEANWKPANKNGPSLATSFVPKNFLYYDV